MNLEQTRIVKVICNMFKGLGGKTRTLSGQKEYCVNTMNSESVYKKHGGQENYRELLHSAAFNHPSRLKKSLSEHVSVFCTCINDRWPRFDVNACSSLPGPEDPHQRLSGEDAGCFAHLWRTATTNPPGHFGTNICCALRRNSDYYLQYYLKDD